MSLIYLPLERLEQRYTTMMYDALVPYCDLVLYPDYAIGTIETGQFLDVNKTCAFKARQLVMVADLFAHGDILDGDVFLVADLFYPGIEMIRYMADLQGIEVYIAGFSYAGRADPTDFVQRLGDWSDYSEAGYLTAADLIFVGSQAHRCQTHVYFRKHFNLDLWSRLQVTGYIWDMEWVRDVWRPGTRDKEDFVVWPHRLCHEKGADLLVAYAEHTDKHIVVTSCGTAHPGEWGLPGNVELRFGLTKAQYYETLDRARWYLSTARQETFGYTLQEAIVYGCQVLVPNVACYPEMVPKINVYNLFPDALTQALEINGLYEVHDDALVVPLGYTEKWHNNTAVVLEKVKTLCASI
ncbi:MAG: glycosyltransferase [Candidatus Latescibacteria bacterium]|nr:glycosyltransferase [Candidatus Latescibacterota bacterium]